jgi:seryl-tRNA synthetase
MGAGTTPRDSATVSTFTRDLIDAGLLVPSGAPGVFGRNGVFESVISGIDALVASTASDLRADVFRIPPVVPRALMEGGGENRALVSSDVVPVPAACLPLYAMLAGPLPTGGRTIDVASYCHRDEPPLDLLGMQSVRVHELVRLGGAEECVAFRDDWLVRGARMLERLGLEARCVRAEASHIGPQGQPVVAHERQPSLAYELVVSIGSSARPAAVASVSWHQAHFGAMFGIRQSSGETAHSACAAFGLERTALALLGTHGVDVAAWDGSVLSVLGL